LYIIPLLFDLLQEMLELYACLITQRHALFVLLEEPIDVGGVGSPPLQPAPRLNDLIERVPINYGRGHPG
jgi:hypothetical protein